MDQDRAKELLRAIHSCQDSGCEVDCEAACEMLEADPELQAWFEEEMGGWSQFDEAVATKFDCCKGREEAKQLCKSAVCAGGRNPFLKVLVPAMAAAALFMVGFFALSGSDASAVEPVPVTSSGNGLEALRMDMAKFVGTGSFELHHESPDFDELKSWLVSNKAPAGVIKSCVVCKEGVGCAVLSWGKKEVSMVCFRDPTFGGCGVVHLFVIARSDLKETEFEDLVQPKSLEVWARDGGVGR